MTSFQAACFTGPRPNKLGGYNRSNPTWVLAEEKAYDLVDVAFRHFEITRFHSGMALGFDMIGAYAVLNAGYDLVACLPFESQFSVWPKDSFHEWFDILTKAKAIYVAGQLVGDHNAFFSRIEELAYAVYGRRERIGPDKFDAIKLLNDRNHFMVNNSQLVLSCWDGTAGGTSKCLDYAFHQRVPSITWELHKQQWHKWFLNEMTLECSSEGDERYSALFAYVDVFGQRGTIENHYQRSKVFPDGTTNLTAREAKKRQHAGQKPIAFQIQGVQYPMRLLTAWYDRLWVKYLDHHPELVSYAAIYDRFTDVFKRNNTLNCQADSINRYIYGGRDSIVNRADVVEFAELLRRNKHA